MASVHHSRVDVPTPDGTADAYFAYPDDGKAHPGVLLYMDAFGLRPHLEAMADRLAAAGYAVLVPNVFYRSRPAPVFDLPEFIDTSRRTTILEQIGPVMRELTPERAMSDAGAYLAWLDSRPEVAEGPIGVTGYCMGARLSLRTAGAYPERVAAAAGFHGGGLATDAPDSPHLVADRITAELYFGHADHDRSLPPEQIERLNEALSAAGVRYRAEVYEGASHGFTQADTSSYNREAAERHWEELLDLFGRALPQP
jgi:carboxymethylenebutenolidase